MDSDIKCQKGFTVKLRRSCGLLGDIDGAGAVALTQNVCALELETI